MDEQIFFRLTFPPLPAFDTIEDARLTDCFLVPFKAWAQQNPTISYISKERVVNIGDTTELECSVQYAQSYPVLWVRIDPRHPESPTIISTGWLYEMLT